MLTYPAYFENHFCNECLCVHWLEVARNGRETCHGENFLPTKASPVHYARRSGHGIELIEKSPSRADLAWQFVAEAR